MAIRFLSGDDLPAMGGTAMAAREVSGAGRTPWAAGACLVALTLVAPPAATVSRQDLVVPGRAREVRVVDADGDGRRDLVVVSVRGYRAEAERMVSVFLGGEEGALAARPDVTGPLPAGAAFLLAAEGRERQALFAVGDGALTRLRADRDGHWRLEPTAVASLPALASESERVGWLDAVAVPSDGSSVAFVPGPEGPRLLRPASGESMALPVAPEPLYFRGPLSDPEWKLWVAQPPAVVADQDGDGRPEVLAFRRDRVTVLRLDRERLRVVQRRDFPVSILTPEELASLEYRVQARFEDLEGKGRYDLVVFVWRDEGLLENSGRVMLYRGEPGGSFAPVATQVLPLEDPVFDYAEVLDLDGDGGSEVLVPSARLGLFAFLRFVANRNVTVGFSLLDLGPEGRLRVGRAAGRTLTASFSDDFDRGAFLFPDVDGDDIRDLVAARGDGELCLHRGEGAGSAWAFSRRSLQCVPEDPFARWRVVDLEGDGAEEVVGVAFEEGRSARVTVYRW